MNAVTKTARLDKQIQLDSTRRYEPIPEDRQPAEAIACHAGHVEADDQVHAKISRIPSLIRIAVAGFVLLYLPQRAHSSPWSESTSPHFSLYAEGHSHQDHDTLRLLERSRNLFLSLGMLNPAREHPITVFAFKEGESFSRYAPPHSAGFFQRGQVADYICLLDQRSNVVLHEYAHAAIATVWPSLPVWLNEGLAGYYSTAMWGRDRLIAGPTALLEPRTTRPRPRTPSLL